MIHNNKGSHLRVLSIRWRGLQDDFFSRLIWLGTILSFWRKNQGTLLPYHGCSRRNDIAQRLKEVPSYIITSYLAGDYFQALRNIIAKSKKKTTVLTSKHNNSEFIEKSWLIVRIGYQKCDWYLLFWFTLLATSKLTNYISFFFQCQTLKYCIM